jgi:hypothetical protein
MNRYVVTVVSSGVTHSLPQGWVVPWVLGLLEGTSDTRPDVVKAVEREILSIPEGTNSVQRCFLTLTICHDHGVIRYQGISRG